eukprot:15127-Eustigmatos_ZCMA.PRE.1
MGDVHMADPFPNMPCMLSVCNVVFPQDEHVITSYTHLKAVIDDEGSLTSQAFSGPHAVHCFTFDHVYDQAADQKKVRGLAVMIGRDVRE